MSYCRPASEIDLIRYGWIPFDLVELNKDSSLEEFVLSVRNGSVESFMYDDEFSAEDKLKLSDQVAEVREFLGMNGFLRPEMMLISMPEIYFTLFYIAKLDLIDDELEEKFFPYFLSNEEYETYDFNYERVEAIIRVLSGFLTEEELGEVTLDMMFMDNINCDETILEKAKKKLMTKKDELVPLLEKAYAMF